MVTLSLGLLLATQPVASELTIYNGGFALVTETRVIDVGTGVQEVHVEDVAERIEPDSVSIQSISDPGSLRVLEQNYQYDLISVQAILNKAVGQEIALIQILPDGTKERVVGTLLSSPTQIIANPNGGSQMTYNGMVLRTDDNRILLNPQGTVEVRSLPDGLISKPTLMWLVDSARRGDNRIELTYLTQGISWEADYVLTLGQDGEMGDLKGWVTLNNQAGATWKDAKLKLLAGEVNRAVQPRLRGGGGFGGGGAMEMRSADAFIEEAFSEYHLYTLQRPTTVANREMKQVSLLEAQNVPVEKRLIIDAMRMNIGHRPGEGTVGLGQIEPLVQIIFRNDEESNMGMPLPEGAFKVYQVDSSGSSLLIGEDWIKHTPRNELVTLNIGRSFDVRADRKRTNFQWLNSPDGTIETFEIEVRNQKEVPTTVHVMERFYLEWEIIQKSMPFTKLDSHTVEFVVELAPGEKQTIIYTVETHWP